MPNSLSKQFGALATRFRTIKPKSFSPYLRLTAYYVAIVMAISVGFSLVVYRVSAVEIDRGLARQGREFNNIGEPFGIPTTQFDNFRLQQIAESKNSLRDKLVYSNLLILVVFSFASYYLAKLAMRPIEEANEAQNRFTADASHELRTPLTAIRAETEVALRDKNMTLGEAKGLLRSNIEEVTKLEELSDALLKLAQYRDSQIKFNSINLSEIIVEAYEKLQSLAEKKEIVFENNLENINVRGEKQSLTELFVILLDNAIKYSPKNSKIKISTKKEGKRAIVSVKDSGVGIKASDLPHIFDRFYRADSSRAKIKANGYGLGLSLAKQIVNLHGGKIHAKSTQGKGSEFFVELSA